MAIAVEELRAAPQAQVERIEPAVRAEPLAEGTFLDALSSLRQQKFPLYGESLPEELDFSKHAHVTRAIYEMAGVTLDDGQHEQEEETGDVQVSEILVFPVPDRRQHMRGTNGSGQPAQVREAGVNLYVDPRDERTYASRFIVGVYSKVPALHGDLKRLANEDMYPSQNGHYHPEKFLTFHSLDDWMNLVQQRKEGENVPLATAMEILGKGIQVKAVTTQDSYPLLSGAKLQAFYDEWEREFKFCGGMKAMRMEQNLQSYHGRGRQRAQAEYDAYRQEAHDEVTIALAEKINPVMYTSTDMAHFTRHTPREIVTMLRKMQPYAV